MTARPIDEPHRVTSPLELLFDLTFVVAVARITVRLAEEVSAGRGLGGIPSFLQVFFAIWWAWMNFTWFASSYDTDDISYRLLTMVQMGGVLVLAAGVPAAVDHGDFRAVTIGYFVMRVGLITLWLRASAEDPPSRSTDRRYAIGIAVVEVGWITRQLLAQTHVIVDVPGRGRRVSPVVVLAGAAGVLVVPLVATFADLAIAVGAIAAVTALVVVVTVLRHPPPESAG
jgi:low temperature requirement protein LtrA